MPTIKELYDAGQRQFPMRGGGISPELIIWGHHFQAKNDKARAGRAFQCVAWRTLDGTNPDGFHALDLLPEPLPDTQAKLDAVLAAGNNLIADVKWRYPNEELRCPYMIALDAAIKAAGGVI